MLDYPFPVVIAIVSIAAFAVAAAVLWALLRAPVGARLVAQPSDARWHAQPTPTFGGVGITEKAEVKDTSGNVISGLFAAGEITGGSFFNNYPGGSGLLKGAVFGRLAGTSAAAYAKAKRA